MKIKFNIPHITGNEQKYLKNVLNRKTFSGEGYYSRKCQDYLENIYKNSKCLLTNSCTDALEFCSILLDLKKGDEVILPAFTFVSTANPIILRGAKPVFADVDYHSMNLSIDDVKKKITKKTKAIFTVNYGGSSCNLFELSNLCKAKKIYLVEDSAQGIGAKYKNKYLGTYGDLATMSFHETKNIHCGEGGCLIINQSKFIKRANLIHEKGTNRKDFKDGMVNKYGWRDVGSSYVVSELQSAFLYAQLFDIRKVTNYRKDLWNEYNQNINNNLFDKQDIKKNDTNGHLYFLLCKGDRKKFINYMSKHNVQVSAHYESLNKSKFFSSIYKYKKCKNSEIAENKLVRLPIWFGMTEKQITHIINLINNYG
jgi:dTDP-4-amino-4,6-dideoxygalactose transaminase